MGLKKTLAELYLKHYKVWLILTLLLIPLSAGVLVVNKVQTGEYLTKGVSLKGGLELEFPVSEISVSELQNHLSNSNPEADIFVRGVSEFGTLISVIIEAANIEEAKLIESINDFGITLEKGDYSLNSTGSKLGESFFRQVIMAVILSFVLMALVVFVVFRNPATSFFVVLAAFSDILATLAVITLMDVRLSAAGIAAFLMLIGYSVDTDILLTTRVTKRKEGTVEQRIMRAMKTGLIMSVTSLAAVLVAFIFTNSEVIRQIMLILTIGLTFDILNTWLQNASILRLYLQWKEKRRHAKIAKQHGAHHG
jgi:preprotein translocase subunit SecF